LDAAAAHDFRRDVRASKKTVQAGVVPSSARAAENHWIRWEEFCGELGLDPRLQGEVESEDPIVLLQVFAHRYRDGRIAPSGEPVRARTVEDAVRAIGQTFATLGATDPRLNSLGQMDFRLKRTWTAWGKQDSPPNRVKPIPVSVLHQVMQIANNSPAGCHFMRAVADMVSLAFFFLLRPGEYTGNKSDTTPFRALDVVLYRSQDDPLDLRSCSEADMLNAVFCTLEFTSQKNGVRGEVIGLAPSGHPLLCPCRALARRIIHFRRFNIAFDKPIASFFTGKLVHVKPADITSTLRNAVALFDSHRLGFRPADVSARSMRAAGAMALLCANVDSNVIRLLGRWRSDEMLRYLHVQARPLMKEFAPKMLAGDFTLMPNHLALVPVR
jgi:hypothetical protein